MANEIKSERVLDILLRGLKGESISVHKLAEEFNVSTRSVSRDISVLNMYFYEHRDTANNAEFIYDSKSKSYLLNMDNFLSGKELLAILKILIASRGITHEELISIMSKLKKHATAVDRHKIEQIIGNELYNYSEIKFDNNNIIDIVWELTDYIKSQNYITISYIKMNRTNVVHRILPVSLMFSEYYFYLIAYEYMEDGSLSSPKYFRVDRIIRIIKHREKFNLDASLQFDESLLRKRSQFMWPGPLRKIRFEFYGPSVQAILDRLPTARIIEKKSNGYIIEAEVFGDGIKMFLLSQGSWVKVTAPDDFRQEFIDELKKMTENY